jgi:Tfp pilus assembly protein PilW
MTLVEMIVALGCAAIILTAFVATGITLSTTMLAVRNYNDLNQWSRNALDVMSRDIRNSSGVGDASTSTCLQLTNINGEVITYNYDGTSGFTRKDQKTSGTTTTILLTNCSAFNFQYFQRFPTNNMTFMTNSSGLASETKIVSITWECSRKILGLKYNTESVQAAQVARRNN